MRDRLAHHHFDTDHALVECVINEELVLLRVAAVTLSEIASSFGNVSGGDQPPTPEADTSSAVRSGLRDVNLRRGGIGPGAALKLSTFRRFGLPG